MRVRNDENCNESKKNFVIAQSSVTSQNNISASKFNASFERKIERLWRQSSDAGWSFNDFAVHLLEVLIILRNRDALKLASAANQKVVVS
jgi:hypothetical protein